MMKAVEVTATVNHQGQLVLDEPLEIHGNTRDRALILIHEEVEESLPTDVDDEPEEIVLDSLRQAWREAMSGQTLPLSELWEGIDAS